MSEARVRTRRLGYEGSGLVFYLVRCAKPKDLAAYVESLPHGVKFMADAIPGGFCHSISAEAIPGVIAEEFGGAVYETRIAVVADDGDPRRERRNWYHEIGHAVNNADVHLMALRREWEQDNADELARQDYYGARCANEETEQPALLNEFLCDALDRFLTREDAPAVSGLPFVIPWSTEYKKGNAK